KGSLRTTSSPVATSTTLIFVCAVGALRDVRLETNASRDASGDSEMFVTSGKSSGIETQCTDSRSSSITATSPRAPTAGCNVALPSVRYSLAATATPSWLAAVATTRWAEDGNFAPVRSGRVDQVMVSRLSRLQASGASATVEIWREPPMLASPRNDENVPGLNSIHSCVLMFIRTVPVESPFEILILTTPGT